MRALPIKDDIHPERIGRGIQDRTEIASTPSGRKPVNVCDDGGTQI